PSGPPATAVLRRCVPEATRRQILPPRSLPPSVRRDCRTKTRPPTLLVLNPSNSSFLDHLMGGEGGGLLLSCTHDARSKNKNSIAFSFALAGCGPEPHSAGKAYVS